LCKARVVLGEGDLAALGWRILEACLREMLTYTAGCQYSASRAITIEMVDSATGW
jgi:hypothetical protein